VVPVGSDVFSLEQLAGKSISTPVGSAAWGMTLKALRDKNMLDKVEIKNQAPPVGVANIAQNKIDAHADFCPWSEVMEFRGTGRKVFDGSEAGISTFEASIKPQWVEALKYNHALLVGETKLAPLDFDRWVDESFVKAAFKAKGLDYEAAKGSGVAWFSLLAGDIISGQCGIGYFHLERLCADQLPRYRRRSGSLSCS
jgi:NitT/TauT family transport system substrate-binding protein